VADVRRVIDLSPMHQLRVKVDDGGMVDLRLYRRPPGAVLPPHRTNAGFRLSAYAAGRLGALLVDMAANLPTNRA